jgi:two-component sensor histidine kinase
MIPAGWERAKAVQRTVQKKDTVIMLRIANQRIGLPFISNIGQNEHLGFFLVHHLVENFFNIRLPVSRKSGTKYPIEFAKD